MRPISKLANVACIEKAREERQAPPLDPRCVHLVDQIFVKFALLCREYDGLYADPRRENAEKLQWVHAFVKHNLISRHQIQVGLDETEKHKWGKPPQLGQFLEWCKSVPDNYGLPHLHEAFRIGSKINELYGNYINPHVGTDTVIRHAINQIGATKYRQMTEREAFKLFEHYYVIACRQYINGEIQDIPRALPEKAEPHPIDRQKSAEARLKAMDAIRGFGIVVERRVPEITK